MTASTPLKGIELVDCARANGLHGIVAATNLCGYGNDVVAFERELQHACQGLGLHAKNFYDLVAIPAPEDPGVEFAPESQSQL